MRRIHSVLGVVASLLVASALAAGGGGDVEAAAKADPQYTQAVAAIKAQQYTRAISLLDAYVARAGSQDADAQNWLGYANRKAGNLPAAFTHYEKALALNPKHRGVHEYMGEAYLMANNLPQAEAHLKALDGLCFFSCEEYRELKASIDSYKARRASLGSAK
jgi:predicted Zn-dependent protease